MQADGQWLGQGCSLDRQRDRQWTYLIAANDQLLRQAAGCVRPRRRTAQVTATRPEVSLLVGQTGLCGAPRGWMHRHRCACLELSRRVKINHPGHFMARDQRFTNGEDTRSAVSVIVQIRPADPDIVHPQPYLSGIWL